jgi:metal-responsive CopG/Arc/MetJ family transcriptional regulator
MIRKTITIQPDIFQALEINQIVNQYQSFSEMVSSALQLLIEKQKKEQYKKAMLEASQDMLYLEDMREINEAFAYVDSETIR